MVNEKIKKCLINEDLSLVEAMRLLSALGTKVLFVHANNKLKASLTDGDIRRYILSFGKLDINVKSVANYNPKYLINATNSEAEQFMKDNLIDAVPIVDENLYIENIIFNNHKIIENKYEKISLPVVMMAGGKGTRLYPYTKVLPKPLIPVGDVPIAERIINQFNVFGCDDYYLIVNHMKNMIKSYFNEIDKSYNIHFIDEEEPLGTGGGLFYLKGIIKNTFVLTNCDILVKDDFSKIYKQHKDSNNSVTMIVANQNIQVPYGVVEFNDSFEIKSMKEKPQISYYTNTGCYIVEPIVINDFINKENIGFPDIIERCKSKGLKVGVYPISEDSFVDMGEIDKLNKANNMYI